MEFQRMLAYVALFLSAFLIWNTWVQDHQATVQHFQSDAPQEITSSIPSSAPVASVATTSQVANYTTAQQTQQGKIITVKTDVLDVQIDTLGGQLVKSDLLAYPESLHSDTPFRLLDSGAGNTYLAQSGVIAGDSASSEAVLYSAKQASYVLASGKEDLSITLTGSMLGVSVVKTYVFHRGEYKVDVNFQVSNTSDQVWQGHTYGQFVRSDTPPKTTGVSRYNFMGAALSTPDKHYEKLTFKSLLKTDISKNTKGGWIAMLQHYFVSSWVPNAGETFHYYSKISPRGDHNVFTVGALSPVFAVAPGQTVEKHLTLYSGPAITQNLDATAPYLNLSIDYGWFWFISVALFWLMQHIYDVIGNWGWSIILVTVTIKLLFYKLSAKSYRSMADMKRLQPRIKMLQSRFENKQELSKATMELYRKEKVNPLGGCLPMLVQIPVFLGLYWVIVESVQLRQAPFMFWIHDLSAKDPYFILPVLMGLTMFVQQKLSPPPPDPTQAKVMMMLPVIFTVFFFSFPAGLVLYWVVNNSLSILQQWYMMRKFANERPKRKK